MPTYEYGCKACGYRFEEFQSMAEAPITICPECGEEQVQRFVSGGAGLIFKGSGFYITDYKNKSSSPGGNGNSQANGSAEKPKTTADSDKSQEPNTNDSK